MLEKKQPILVASNDIITGLYLLLLTFAIFCD